MHYEELQIADTSFKHMNTYRYLNNQIANYFINNIYYSQWKIPQKILKNIHQEHRFRKLNTLTVNEKKTAENEIVPLQHYSLNRMDTFHFSLSPTGKIAVSFAKRSSSSYKQTFTKFSREKALSHSYFRIFKLQPLTLRDPPDL